MLLLRVVVVRFAVGNFYFHFPFQVAATGSQSDSSRRMHLLPLSSYLLSVCCLFVWVLASVCVCTAHKPMRHDSGWSIAVEPSGFACVNAIACSAFSSASSSSPISTHASVPAFRCNSVVCHDWAITASSNADSTRCACDLVCAFAAAACRCCRAKLWCSTHSAARTTYSTACWLFVHISATSRSHCPGQRFVCVCRSCCRHRFVYVYCRSRFSSSGTVFRCSLLIVCLGGFAL